MLAHSIRVIYLSQLTKFFHIYGVHYLILPDGTTIATRTIHIGKPSDKEKERFTRVLKGFISVASAIFPSNASVKLTVNDLE